MLRLAFLLLAVSIIFAACEEPLEIYLTESNPPTFKFSGSGTLLSLVVYDVNSPDPNEILWKIVPQKEIHAWYLPEIIYGIVPDGFVQEIPKDGPPAPLKEGRIYSIGGPASGAQGGSIWFTIKDGKAVRVAKTDGTRDR